MTTQETTQKFIDMIAADIRVIAIELDEVNMEARNFDNIQKIVEKLRDIASILNNPETAKYYMLVHLVRCHVKTCNCKEFRPAKPEAKSK